MSKPSEFPIDYIFGISKLFALTLEGEVHVFESYFWFSPKCFGNQKHQLGIQKFRLFEIILDMCI